LLVNLGTPEAPTTAAVRRYLKEFLSDPRVVEVPRPLWWVVLRLVVLPFRANKSALGYRTIWTERGSPLLTATQDLRDLLVQRTGWSDRVQVEVAMRYGAPSIPAKLEAMRGKIDTLIVLPLYPQYSAATTGSAFDAVDAVLRSWRRVPSVHLLGAYHREPGYLHAIASRIRAFWQERGRPERLLFSFHGLPRRCIELGDPYAAQCQETARRLADRLGLVESHWQLVYQSRFGRAEWLEPGCLEVLRELPKQGVRRVDVVCPGFAVDCLETLEEIAVRNRDEFLQAGGVEYCYIPALNASPEHADLLAGLIERYLPRPEVSEVADDSAPTRGTMAIRRDPSATV
jgi:ferrochelatase